MTGTLPGMGSHQSARAESVEWLTPPVILARLGVFDLDPCGHPSWPVAKTTVIPPADGLAMRWWDRVWLNPPYGAEVGQWLGKLAAHGWGTALIFARTETAAWRQFVWGAATSVLFLDGRLHFYRPDGSRAEANAGAPSALIAYGDADAAALRDAGLPGYYVSSWTRTGPARWSW